MNGFDPNANTNPTVVLSADAKPFERELDATVQKYRQFVGNMEAQTKALGDKIRSQSVLKGMRDELNKLTGKVDKLTSLAGFSLTAQIADMTSELGKQALAWASGTAEVVKQLERAKELNEKIAAAQAKRIAAAAEMTGALGAGGSAAMLSALQDELARTQKELEGKNATVRQKRQEREGFDDAFSSKLAFQSYLTRNLEENRATAQTELDSAKAGADALQSRISEIQEKMRRLQNPLADPEKIAGVERMVAELEKARLTLGMSEESAKRLSLEFDGFASEQIEKVMSEFGELEGSKRAQKVYDITKELQKQADTYGKTANQIKLYELASEGYAQSQLDQIEQQMRASEAIIAQKQKEAEFAEQLKKYQEDQLKIGESGLVGAMGAGTSGAANAIAAARADTSRFANATPEQKAEQTRQQQLRAQLQAASEIQKLGSHMLQLVTLFENLSTT